MTTTTASPVRPGRLPPMATAARACEPRRVPEPSGLCAEGFPPTTSWPSGPSTTAAPNPGHMPQPGAAAIDHRHIHIGVGSTEYRRRY
jgi:hypothetical protein